jgi:hypothetical protein
MLKEIVSDFIEKDNTLITASPGNGSTVITMLFVNLLLRENKTILYYNPTTDIDEHFVKLNYPLLSTDLFFHKESLSLLLQFLKHINYKIDYLVLDSGDTLLVKRELLPLLRQQLLKNCCKIIATSQIRQDPNKGGQVYSPLEVLNKKYNNELFKTSIWIRDVTEPTSICKSRYLDIYNNNRDGNNFVRRYIAKFDTKTGIVYE